jgi:hypothetical protein
MATIRNNFHEITNELNKICMLTLVNKEILKDIDLDKVSKEELAETIKIAVDELGKAGDCIKAADDMIMLIKPYIYEKLGGDTEIPEKSGEAHA